MEAVHNWWIKARAVLSETTLYLRASRIPKSVTNYSVTFCSKMPKLAVIRATFGVRRRPVGLNVNRHFTIARTQQQLSKQITTTKRSRMSPSERHFTLLTKQAIPRKLNLFSYCIRLVLQKCVILFLFSMAEGSTRAGDASRVRILYPTRKRTHPVGLPRTTYQLVAKAAT
jgi:hypothetical protein